MRRLQNSYRILSFEKAIQETKDNKEFLNIGPTPHNEDCTPSYEHTPGEELLRLNEEYSLKVESAWITGMMRQNKSLLKAGIICM